MQLTFNINTSNPLDFQEAIWLLLSYNRELDYAKIAEQILTMPRMQSYKVSLCQNLINTGAISNPTNIELENKLKELEDALKRQQDETIKQTEKIEKKDKAIEDLKNELSKFKKDSQENEETLNKMIAEAEEKFQKAEKDIEQLKANHTSEIAEKDQEINELKKMLESYSVSFGADDPSEKKYFKVNDGILTETTIVKSSSYCASKKGDFYKFAINYYGPIKAACDNVELYLEPFCEIVERTEGANFIALHEIGTAKYNGSGLQVIEKAKISLIKQ